MKLLHHLWTGFLWYLLVWQWFQLFLLLTWIEPCCLWRPWNPPKPRRKSPSMKQSEPSFLKHHSAPVWLKVQANTNTGIMIPSDWYFSGIIGIYKPNQPNMFCSECSKDWPWYGRILCHLPPFLCHPSHLCPVVRIQISSWRHLSGFNGQRWLEKWSPLAIGIDLYIYTLRTSQRILNEKISIAIFLNHRRAYIYIYIYAGWWFGTFFIFLFHIWDNPSHWRTHIFQDCFLTTNQYVWQIFAWGHGADCFLSFALDFCRNVGPPSFDLMVKTKQFQP